MIAVRCRMLVFVYLASCFNYVNDPWPLKLFNSYIVVSFFIFCIHHHTGVLVYISLTMDDENGSSNVFKIFLTSMVHSIQRSFNDEQQHYNISYKFNTSCTKEIQCENTAMFCNLTTLRCQCAVFHFWNETFGICQYKHEHLAEWLDSSRTNDNNYITEIVQDPLVSRYTIPLPVTVVMILGGLCFLLCAAYVCYGHDEVDGEKSLSAALCKQKEQSCKIQMSLMENF